MSVLLLTLLVTQPGRPRVPRTPQVKTVTVDATIQDISPSALLVEVDGETGPIGLGRQTQLVVMGEVEPGLIGVGSYVEASGYLREPGKLSDARLTLHVTAATLPKSQVRQVKQVDPLVTCTGRIVAAEPLTMLCQDGLQLVGETPQPNQQPPMSRPAYKQRLVIDVSKADEPVRANFGAMPKLVSKGDKAKIVVPEQGRRVAQRVTVTREAVVTVEDIKGKAK